MYRVLAVNTYNGDRRGAREPVAKHTTKLSEELATYQPIKLITHIDLNGLELKETTDPNILQAWVKYSFRN